MRKVKTAILQQPIDAVGVPSKKTLTSNEHLQMEVDDTFLHVYYKGIKGGLPLPNVAYLVFEDVE